MVYFLGNVARLCTNTFYIAFSMSRYILRLNLRRFYSFMSLFALGFSSYKIFQFKVNDFIPFYETNYPFAAFGTQANILLQRGRTGFVQAVKSKEKINRMVINNGILYFVLHVPEFVVILLLLVYKNGLSCYCTNFFILLIVDIY